MVETIVALLFVFFAFLAVFQFADNLRTKLLLNYASFRCARARTVGYNDYKLLKTARLATVSAAGECLVKDTRGNSLSAGAIAALMKTYLGCPYEAAADRVLDFAYWDSAYTEEPVCRVAGDQITLRTQQNRPQFFDVFNFFVPPAASTVDAEDRPTYSLTGETTIEAHYPAYLQ